MLSNLKNWFKLEQRPLVGIDISGTTVKLLELSRHQNLYCVDAYASADLPPNTMVEGNIAQISALAQTIATVVAASKTKRRYAAISVSGSSVLTRVIQIASAFSDNDIMEHIELEADRYIPYPLEQVYYDFEVLGVSEKDPEFVDVQLVAAKIETVDSRSEALEQAGMKATIADVTAFAMQRAFDLILSQFPEEAVKENIALFDLGASVSTLYIFKNASSIYSRDQIFGIKQLADETERRYGFSRTASVAAIQTGDLPEDYHKEVLEPFKESVASQVNRALQLFFSSTDETNVQYLVLSGSVGQLPGLDKTLEIKTGIKTVIANPFANLQISPEVNKILLQEDAPSLLLSLGLALRNFDR